MKPKFVQSGTAGGASGKKKRAEPGTISNKVLFLEGYCYGN